MLEFPDLLPFDWNDPQLFTFYYKVYLEYIYNKLPTFLGASIWCRVEPLYDEMHECFWHITTCEDKDLRKRVPEKERMQRIHWIPFLIEHAMSPDVLCWEKEEKGGRLRTYIWSRPNKFAIILEKQKTSYRLVTAYQTNLKGTLEKFKKESKRYPDPRKQTES